jgi:Flp pilus assembly protein TadG
MRKFLSLRKFSRSESGQIFLWLALGVPLLILFSALALDMGMIYRTKARLSNAVDSAVLTGAKNYSLGTTTAQVLANDMFYANLGTACGSGGVTCSWVWCPANASCPTGSAITATLTATTPWKTTFMAYLPQWATWTLGDTGQATRSTLIMSLVLDRSGSMSSDGGGTALQAAVPQFLEDFTPGTDYIGLVSFASHADVDVNIGTGWGPYNTGTIATAVAAYNFTGGTFGGGAGSGTLYSAANGPPLNLADNQNNSVILGSGVPKVKVVVYFTDGLMNTLQDQFTCGGTPNTLVNYGGVDPDNPGEGAPYPAEGVYGLNPLAEIPSSGPFYCYDPTTDPDYPNCNSPNTTQMVTYQNTTCTYNGSKAVFPSEESGGAQTLTRWHVSNDVKYRTKITANNMRSETVPTYIFTIGLSAAVSNDPCTQAFLATLANDPGAANYGGGANCDSGPGVYNSSLPAGLFVIVPGCPGATCTTELETAFQLIASKVLLRLSQ